MRTILGVTLAILMLDFTAALYIGCQKDAKLCPDGTVLSRDKLNNCLFPPCPVLCTQEVMLCPDGSNWVGRDPNNNCQFMPCEEDWPTM